MKAVGYITMQLTYPYTRNQPSIQTIILNNLSDTFSFMLQHFIKWQDTTAEAKSGQIIM
jgi:hypothetical protein